MMNSLTSILSTEASVVMTDFRYLQDQITRIFSEALVLDVPSPTTDIIETGLLDSLGLVDLLMCLEQHFGTSILTSDLEVDNFRSISMITQLVAEKINPAAVARRQQA